MKSTKAAPWVIGTALVAVLVLAAAWFLAISPQLEEATSSRDQTEQELSRAELLKSQIAKLQEDFAQIETYRATLATLQVKVPPVPDQASFNRELATLSETSGAFVVEVASSTAVPVLAQNDASGGAAAMAGAGAPAGLFAIPMTVTILGTPDQVLAYVNGLRTSTKRAFLVTGISLTGQEEAGAASGRPATANGDAEVVISGHAYVLDPAVAPEVPADAAAAEAAPAAS